MRNVSERAILQREQRADDIEDVLKRRFKPDGTWAKPPQPIKVYGAELSEFIEQCLEMLPTAQRMAFVLREVQELTTEEICKILDVSTTNLGVLLYRGRNRLRECLEDKGVRGSHGSEL